MTLTTESEATDPAVATPPPGTSRPRTVGDRVRLAASRVVAGIFVLAVLACVAAPWLPVADPNRKDVSEGMRPPFWESGGDLGHPLGTDQLGQDVFSRLLFGGRLTLVMVLLAVLLAAVIGVALGIAAGYRGGWLDGIISRLVDAQLALPFVLLALTIVIAVGQDVTDIVLVLVVGAWAQFARISRAEVIALRNRTFMVALRAAGISTWSIVVRHLLPNLLPAVLVVASLQVGVLILAEAGLSFLAMGVRPPDITWGTMLTGGKDYMRTAWWIITLPGVCIVLAALGVNILADAVRDRLDPTVTRSGRRR